MWRIIVALFFLIVLFICVAMLAMEVTPAVRTLPPEEPAQAPRAVTWESEQARIGYED